MLLIFSLLACDEPTSCEQLRQELCIEGEFDARGVHADDDGGWIAGTALSSVRVLNGSTFEEGGLVVGWDLYGDESWSIELDDVTAVEADDAGIWVGTSAGTAFYIQDGQVVEERDLGDAVRDLIVGEHGLVAVTETELIMPWGARWDSSAFEPHEVALDGDLVLIGGQPKASFDEVPAGGAAVVALDEDLEMQWVYAREGQLSGLVAGDAGIFAGGPVDGDLWLDRLSDGERVGGSAWGQVGQEGLHQLALVDDRLALVGWTLSAEGSVPWLEWRSATGGLQGHDELAPPELKALPGAVAFGDEVVLAVEIGVEGDPATSVIRVD